MDDANTLLASLMVSTVGAALFVYGKKQVRIPHLVVGLVMVAFPYFVPGALLIAGIGVVLLLLLWLSVRLGW